MRGSRRDREGLLVPEITVSPRLSCFPQMSSRKEIAVPILDAGLGTVALQLATELGSNPGRALGQTSLHVGSSGVQNKETSSDIQTHSGLLLTSAVRTGLSVSSGGADSRTPWALRSRHEAPLTLDPQQRRENPVSLTLARLSHRTCHPCRFFSRHPPDGK